MRSLVLCSLLCLYTQSFAHTVDIFTTHQIGADGHSFAGNTVQVFYVDDYANLMNTLNNQLNVNGIDQKTANNVATQYLKQYSADILAASNAVVEAKNLGVTSIPSIVIDGKYQIVGTTDVALALQSCTDLLGQNKGGIANG